MQCGVELHSSLTLAVSGTVVPWVREEAAGNGYALLFHHATLVKERLFHTPIVTDEQQIVTDRHRNADKTRHSTRSRSQARTERLQT